MKSNRACYYGYRFPPGITSYAIWVYSSLLRVVDQDGEVINILIQPES